jgi:hypothetical protein
MNTAVKIKELIEFYTNIRVKKYRMFKRNGIWVIVLEVDLDDGEISDEFDSASPDLSDKIDKLNFDLVDYISGKLYFEENV